MRASILPLTLAFLLTSEPQGPAAGACESLRTTKKSSGYVLDTGRSAASVTDGQGI